MMINGLQGDGAVQSYYNDAMNPEMSYQTARHRRRDVVGRRAPEHDSARRRQPVQRRLQGGRPARRVAVEQPDRPPQGQGPDRPATPSTASSTTPSSLGGPIKKDKLWFFASARYFSVNNFIANTFMDDGSQGIDDQFIRSAHGAPDVAGRRRATRSRATSTRSTSTAATTCRPTTIPRRRRRCGTRRRITPPAIKWTSPVTSSLFLEAASRTTPSTTPTSTARASRSRAARAEWFANAAQNELDLGGYTKAGPTNTTESPKALYWNAAATYVTGDHTIKVGANNRWGTFMHTRDANADLMQQYRSSTHRRPLVACPTRVLIRNTPLVYGERLNHDLGIYVQDSWRLNRLTANVGLRWETLNAQVLAGESPAGRFVPARTFDEIEDVPNWNDFAPRMALVYDLFGNGKTALKYSLNRYNLSRTTGIAANYNPLLSQTATLPWRDINGDDIAEGALRCTGYPSAACEINFASLSPNFGIAALNEYGEYPRTWNLETGLEMQHELLAGLSVAGSWWKGNFHNLTTTVNQLVDARPTTRRTPSTTRSPAQPFRSTPAARPRTARPTSNLDTFDPERKQRLRVVQLRGPVAHSRRRPDLRRRRRSSASASRPAPRRTIPNYGGNGKALCDEFALDIPYRPQLKLSGTKDIGCGINVSMAFQNNSQPDQLARHDRDARHTRYPANCPSPCPAGQIIMPTAVLRPDDADLQPRVGPRHRRSSASSSSTSRCRGRSGSAAPGAADVRGVQHEQLGRDHQLHHAPTCCRRRTSRRTASCRAGCTASAS